MKTLPASFLSAVLVVSWLACAFGCAESKDARIQSATVGGRAPDAGDEDGGAESEGDACTAQGGGDEHREVEPNDSARTARLLAPCRSYLVRGGGRGEADDDWFKVRVPSGVTSLSVTVRVLRGTGPELWILRAENEPIEHRALPASATVVLTTGVTSGDYFIRTRTGAGSEHALLVQLGAERYELEESNDDAASAQVIALDTTYTAQDSSFGAGAELDWFRIDVPEGAGRLTVELADLGEPDPIESELWLVKAGAPAIEHRVLRGGDATTVTIGVAVGAYFVRVRPGEHRVYTVRAALHEAPFELEECNDVSETAQTIAFGAPYEGQDSAPDAELDWDWFRIDVPADTTSLALTVRDVGDGAVSGTALWLYGSAQLLIEHRTLAAGETLVLHSGVVEGAYFLKVLVGLGRSYTLEVELSDEPFEIEQSNDQRDAAQWIEQGVGYTGQDSALETEPRDEDWFRIAVPHGVTELTVSLADLGGGPGVPADATLYDESGIQIGYIEPLFDDEISATFPVRAGEHALLVRNGRGRQYRVVAAF